MRGAVRICSEGPVPALPVLLITAVKLTLQCIYLRGFML
jgi:hypothetical protein